jgi:prevent-host-death family protein
MGVLPLQSGYDVDVNVVSSEVGVRELKAKLSAYLAAVQSGQEFLVTDRGRPVARLSPVRGGADEHLARLIEEGRLILPRSRDRSLPQPRNRLTSGSIVDFLREQRR